MVLTSTIWFKKKKKKYLTSFGQCIENKNLLYEQKQIYHEVWNSFQNHQEAEETGGRPSRNAPHRRSELAAGAATPTSTL